MRSVPRSTGMGSVWVMTSTAIGVTRSLDTYSPDPNTARAATCQAGSL